MAKKVIDLDNQNQQSGFGSGIPMITEDPGFSFEKECFYEEDDIMGAILTLYEAFKLKDTNPEEAYKLLDTDRGYIVGDSYDETECYFQDDKIIPRFAGEMFLEVITLKARNLLLFLNHCLSWLMFYARPRCPATQRDAKLIDDEYNFLIQWRRYVINILYSMSPERYEVFLACEPITRCFHYWNPNDGLRLPEPKKNPYL